MLGAKCRWRPAFSRSDSDSQPPRVICYLTLSYTLSFSGNTLNQATVAKILLANRDISAIIDSTILQETRIMLMPNTDDFTLAVQQCRKQRADQARRGKKAFAAGLVAAGEIAGLPQLEFSFAALVGAIEEVAARLADPAARQRLEALGAAKIAKVAPADPENVVVVLPAPATPDLTAELEERGLRIDSDWHVGGEGRQAWIGRTLARDVSALVSPAGGAVTAIQLPTTPKAPVRRRSAKRATVEAEPAAGAPDPEAPAIDGVTPGAAAPQADQAGDDATTATADSVAANPPNADPGDGGQAPDAAEALANPPSVTVAIPSAMQGLRHGLGRRPLS